MKHIFAGAVLIANAIAIMGLFAAATPAAAQIMPAEKCYDCPAPKVYDTQETIRTTKDVDQSQVINTQSEVEVPRRVKETNHLVVRENQTRNVGVVQHNHTIYERVPRNAATPPAAQVRSAENCYDCPAPREHYDSQETIHTTNDVDKSQVINTQSEVEVSRRVKKTNHLVIRENETRNVGVVQHNHTIYERVPRYVVRVPAVTVVRFVTQRYHVVETPATMTVPVSVRPVSRCSRGGRYDRYGSGTDDSCRRVLRVRG